MMNLIKQLNDEAGRLQVAPTGESDGLVFEPVKDNPDLAVWIDQEVSGAYNGQQLLAALKAINPLSEAEVEEDFDRENFEHVCFAVQELEKQDVETDDDAVTYVLA